MSKGKQIKMINESNWLMNRKLYYLLEFGHRNKSDISIFYLYVVLDVL